MRHAPPTAVAALSPTRGPEILDGGVRFHLAAPRAERVQLCLFDTPDGPETRRVEMTGSEGAWTCEVDGAATGQLYGYRVHGPWNPEHGARFNPAKLLLDPASRATRGELRWNDALLSARPGRHEPDARDSAPWMPRSVVVATPEPAVRPPRARVPWSETVVYEAHVRGLTKLHPEVLPELRGTYLGLACDPVIDHLRRLGVTTVELMPVAQFYPERHLLESGRPAYWGYSPAAFLAPHGGFATSDDGRQVQELRTMVDRLHDAGLEVVVDVVLNHTMEGGEGGPTVSLRGVDDGAYYRHEPGRPERYQDFTGCGNTVDVSSPLGLELVVGALAHWVRAFDVDGFRFDLAPTLGRDPVEFSSDAPFFRRLAEDPVFRGIKWIAEPWDLGPWGYQVGKFPPGWGEWNDHFRDGVRSFWRGDDQRLSDLAQRLTGSRELFEPRLRTPSASINYVACHDGFTLADLVSYERKHNEGNGEENRDGPNHNLSRNWGVEGPTDDPEILEFRQRRARSLLATVALAAGVPMLCHGDERLRTQDGNNNAYCQDGPITWVDWSGGDSADAMADFTRRLFSVRRRRPIFGETGGAHGRWLHPSGGDMTTDDWNDPGAHALGWLRGDRLLLLNGGADAVRFRLANVDLGGPWLRLLDTVSGDGQGPEVEGSEVLVAAGGLLYLTRVEPDASGP